MYLYYPLHRTCRYYTIRLTLWPSANLTDLKNFDSSSLHLYRLKINKNPLLNPQRKRTDIQFPKTAKKNVSPCFVTGA